MIRIVAIDDEPASLNTIANILTRHCPDVQLIGQASDLTSGIQIIQEESPDLVLLDIKLGKDSGFDLLEKIESPTFHVIFITAFEEFALKAFRFEALDYILKPIDPQDMIEAVSRYKNIRSGKKTGLNKPFNPGKADQSKDLVLNTMDSTYVVRLKDIIHFNSDHGYTRFHLVDGSSILVSKTINKYYHLLEKFDFFRTHKSHVINLRHMKRFDRKKDLTVRMSDGSSVPVAHRRKDVLAKIIRENNIYFSEHSSD